MAQDMADDAEIQELIAAINSDDVNDLALVDRLLAGYPEDARLHFMRGSILAGRGEAIAAHGAMSKAVEIAPHYALARYQLGLFELTSGEPERALSTWGPLHTLAADNYLRVFVEGMTHLIRDEFAEAIERLEHGIALNAENQPMNNDARMLIGECRRLSEDTASPEKQGELSPTALMLNQFTTRTLQ